VSITLDDPAEQVCWVVFVFAAWIALRRVQRPLMKPSLDELTVIVAAGAVAAASIAAKAQPQAAVSLLHRIRITLLRRRDMP
jgi:hypothetical protein